jgi:hypothetical protein
LKQILYQKSLTVVEALGFKAIARSLHKTRMTFPSTTGTACMSIYNMHQYASNGLLQE